MAETTRRTAEDVVGHVLAADGSGSVRAAWCRSWRGGRLTLRNGYQTRPGQTRADELTLASPKPRPSGVQEA